MGSSIGSVLGAAAGIGLGIASGGTSWAFSPMLGGMLGGSLGGGIDASNAASKAAGQQAAATQQANATQQGMYQQNYGNLYPWLAQGGQAGSQLNYLMGLGSPTATGVNTAMGGYGSLATPFSQTNWQMDPGYAFRLQQGQQALERSAAAKGMTLSGAQQKALTAYGQGMGSQEYQNAYNRYQTDQGNLYNRLAGISGTGLQAGSALAGVGQNVANQISGNLMNLGAGQAALTTAGQAAQQSALNQAGNLYNNYSMWNSMMNTPSSTGPAMNAYNAWLAAGGAKPA